MSSNSSQAAAKLAYERATVKNTQGQTVNDQLRASRGAFNQTPSKPGGWSPSAGSKMTSFAPKITKAAAPLNPRTGRSYSSGRGW